MESSMPKHSLCRYLHPALQEIPDSNPLASHQQEILISFYIFGNKDFTLGKISTWVDSSAGYASDLKSEGCGYDSRCVKHIYI